MSTINLKLKSYDELIFEITTLNTNNYLLQQKVEQLENMNKVLIEKIKEYIEKNVVCCKSGDMLVELNVDDLLNILNKGSDK